MSKLALTSRVPRTYDAASIQDIVRQLEQQINALAEGRIVARHAASASVPTAGAFARSDITWDTTATVSNGTVRLGWVNTAAGSPGTQTEMRALTEDAAYKPVLGAEVAATSGTSLDFTSIPAWVKRITVSLIGVSTNGTTAIRLQLGDAGGVEATGYHSCFGHITGSNACNFTASTSGFDLVNGSATNLYYGKWILSLEDASDFTWACAGGFNISDASSISGGGSKALSATLDRIRLTTGNGTDTFDAGAINVMFE